MSETKYWLVMADIWIEAMSAKDAEKAVGLALIGREDVRAVDAIAEPTEEGGWEYV